MEKIFNVLNSIVKVLNTLNNVKSAMNSYYDWIDKPKRDSATNMAAVTANTLTSLNRNLDYDKVYDSSYKIAYNALNVTYAATVKFIPISSLPIAGYTKHGLNSAINHDGVGVSPKSILDTVRNPNKIILQSGGKVKYIGNTSKVILNPDGKVITTWPTTREAYRIKIK